MTCPRCKSHNITPAILGYFTCNVCGHTWKKEQRVDDKEIEQLIKFLIEEEAIVPRWVLTPMPKGERAEERV